VEVHIGLDCVGQHLLILTEDTLGAQPGHGLLLFGHVLQVKGRPITIHVVKTFFRLEAYYTGVRFVDVELVKKILLGFKAWQIAIIHA
jgi:hypothetical protein